MKIELKKDKKTLGFGNDKKEEEYENIKRIDDNICTFEEYLDNQIQKTNIEVNKVDNIGEYLLTSLSIFKIIINTFQANVSEFLYNYKSFSIKY